jgi:hypothetical protein
MYQLLNNIWGNTNTIERLLCGIIILIVISMILIYLSWKKLK